MQIAVNVANTNFSIFYCNFTLFLFYHKIQIRRGCVDYSQRSWVVVGVKVVALIFMVLIIFTHFNNFFKQNNCRVRLNCKTYIISFLKVIRNLVA